MACRELQKWQRPSIRKWRSYFIISRHGPRAAQLISNISGLILDLIHKFGTGKRLLKNWISAHADNKLHFTWESAETCLVNFIAGVFPPCFMRGCPWSIYKSSHWEIERFQGVVCCTESLSAATGKNCNSSRQNLPHDFQSILSRKKIGS